MRFTDPPLREIRDRADKLPPLVSECKRKYITSAAQYNKTNPVVSYHDFEDEHKLYNPISVYIQTTG